MTKPGQDNNLNYVNFLKYFYEYPWTIAWFMEYHTEKCRYRDVTCLILKFCHDKFATTAFVATFSPF